MKLIKLRGAPSGCCDGDEWPTIFVTDRNSIIVRGWVVTDVEAVDALALPDNETAVEIPLRMLPEVLEHEG